MRQASRQTDDPAVLIDVDPFGGGPFGQAGHADDVAGERDQEAGPGGDLDVADRQRESLAGGRAAWDCRRASLASWPCRSAACRSRACSPS